MSRDRIAEHVGAGRRSAASSGLVMSSRPAHDARMQLVPTQLIVRIRRRIAGPQRTPEEILQRHGDKLAAEARMRGEIDRAVKLWGRTSRHVR